MLLLLKRELLNYITKPVIPDEVLNVITRALDRCSTTNSIIIPGWLFPEEKIIKF